LLLGTQTLHKALDLTSGIDDALFTRIKWVAFVANVGMNFFFCRSSRPRITARAHDNRIGIPSGMNTVFHSPKPFCIDNSNTALRRIALGIHTNLFLCFAEWFEFDETIDQRIQRVVFAETHVQAGANVRAALANDDRSSLHVLTVKSLDAQALGITVATISSRTATFFVCHIFAPLEIGD